MCMCKPALTAFTIKLCHFGGYLHSDTPDPHPQLKEKKQKTCLNILCKFPSASIYQVCNV